MAWLLKTHHHLLGGSLLIAGTSIGVGMLALPVVTSAAGFFPALIVYLICWIFMNALGFLIAETCTWMPKNSNLITITRTLLGNKGAISCWILYLFLFYCLMIAHTAAGGAAVFHLCRDALPEWLSKIVYVGLFAPVVYLGTRAVDRVNMLLLVGVVITYSLFLGTTLPYLEPEYLERQNWAQIWYALPVILTAFGFQNLIPTLYNYMEGDYRKLRLAIWIGTSIPLVLYVLWEFTVLGVVPPEGLEAAKNAGHGAVPALQDALNSKALGSIAQAFAFFAMTTSFVGISIAFFDFLADGLKWKRTGPTHLLLILLVFMIPLLIVFIDPTIFLSAVSLFGIGMILLFGVLPILCVWSGRYIHRFGEKRRFLPGGKYMLFFLFLFCLLVLLSQL